MLFDHIAPFFVGYEFRNQLCVLSERTMNCELVRRNAHFFAGRRCWTVVAVVSMRSQAKSCGMPSTFAQNLC